MNILHISCSPRGQASESYRLSRKIIDLLQQGRPNTSIATRMLDQDCIGHVDAQYALAQQSSGGDIWAQGSIAHSEQLIGELERADVVVIATPMHNLSLPSSLKAWIDHVVRAHRTFHLTPAGKAGALRDRPVYIAVASGGIYSGERARQPDFLTPYLKVVLGTIGLHDLSFFSIQGTGLNPDAVAAARIRTEQALQAHFAALE